MEEKQIFKEWRAHAHEFSLGMERVCCGVFDQASNQYTRSPDTGMRAALRLGLRKPVEQFSQAAHKCVFDVALHTDLTMVREAWLTPDSAWLTPDSARLGPARERAYYAVAAMIAAQARDARDQSRLTTASTVPPGGLGVSIAVMDRGESVEEETPREKELRALSRLSLDGVHRALPDLVGHLRSEQIAVDWAQLILDLSSWLYRRDEVAKRWNQDYYRTRYKQAAAARDQKNAHPSTTVGNQEGQTA